jgi:antitoxin CcdA
MLKNLATSSRKGRLSLSIDQRLLERLEPFKATVNLSAQAERFLTDMLDELESRAWVERNAGALEAHGRDIGATGLAGEEFERV